MTTDGSEVAVTVVVPTFNGCQFLAETLRAVAAQSQVGVELIVVDDGSTDGTVATVKAHAPAARLVQQRNQGVSAARNAGLALARGRYVIFLDQDDVWHPDMLRRQVEWLETHPEHDVAVCRYQHWHPLPEGGYGAIEALWPPAREGVEAAFTGWVYHQFLLDCWALTSGTLMRAGVVRALGGFDPTLPYSEDWDLWIRLSQTSQFVLLHWPPVLYRQHADQGSRQPRSCDYRCMLLDRAARCWGLTSRDGRSVSTMQFRRQLSHFSFEYGYHHLHAGSRLRGVAAMLRSWRLDPTHWRALALAVMSAVGWRPSP
jgi:GT2 family glycosyltransferase